MESVNMSSFFRRLEKYNNRHRGYIRRLFYYLEFLFLILSFPLTYWFFEKFAGIDLEIDFLQYLIFGMIMLISWYVKSKINSRARLPRTQRYLYLIFSNTQAYFIITVVVISLKFLLRLSSIPVSFIITYLLFFFLLTTLYNMLGYHFLKIYRASGYNLHRVLIFADGFSDQIIEKLIDQKEWGFKIRAIISNSKLINKKFGKKIKVIPEGKDLTPMLEEKVIDEIIYCKSIIDDKQVKELLRICNEIGIIFRLQSTVSPIDHLNFQLRTMNETKHLPLVDGPANRFSLLIKTVGDYYFSIAAMILLFPLFILIASLIKLDSRGPIFFKQERIGLRGRKFQLYKFRTMIVDAEDKLGELKSKNESDGPVFKIKDDPRITRVGKFLRKTGLDELPQLQNVIKGEMSLIGPRPPLESEVKQYERWQLRRLSVKPGMTCTWQVEPNRHDVKFDNWMKMDLNYIDNWSLTKDVVLFFKTVSIIFFASGR